MHRDAATWKAQDGKAAAHEVAGKLAGKPVTCAELVDDALEHSKTQSPRSTKELELKYQMLTQVFGSRVAEEISKQKSLAGSQLWRLTAAGRRPP